MSKAPDTSSQTIAIKEGKTPNSSGKKKVSICIHLPSSGPDID